MRMLFGLLIAALLTAGGAARAACHIQIDVAAPLTSSEDMRWHGCAASGRTLQAALDTVAAQGGGSVMLGGPGSVLVQAPLSLGRGTTLSGDRRRPLGMSLVPGAPDGCRGADGFRHFDCPLVRVEGLAGPPPPGERNATVWNLRFDGTLPGRPLTAPAVAVRRAAHVTVAHTHAAGARYIAYLVHGSTDVSLNYVAAELAQGDGAQVDALGGAGVWIAGSSDVMLAHAHLSALPFYSAGYPRRPPWDSQENTRELVAIYGSDDARVVHSRLQYTNTAAVYLAECPAEICATPRRNRNTTLWNNDIRYTRQHGIDVAGSDGVQLHANRIGDTGHAGIALAAVVEGELKFNRIERTGKEQLREPLESRGAILLKWQTRSVHVEGNSIAAAPAATPGSPERRAIFVEEASDITVRGNRVHAG